MIAVGLSVLAFRTVNQSPNAVAQLPAATATPPTVPDDDSAVTSDGPADDGDEVTSEGPVDEVDVEDWVEAWAGSDADLLVIGDGYSSLPDQWVQLWAGIVGRERPVTIRTWNASSDSAFEEPVRLSDADGPALRVWNASRSQSTIADAAGNVARFDDASSDSEAVLVSLGQANGAEEVAEELDTLLSEIGDLPVLVVVGPESLYDDGVAGAMSGWAQDNDDRVAVVDLSAELGAQPTADEWAQAFARAVDGVSASD